MKVIDTKGNPNVAQVILIALEDGAIIECVASVQRPIPRDEKWVLVVSTLKGCPVNCPMCDAGGHYRGKLTSDELLFQIDTLIETRARRNEPLPTKRLKIQFARMGDPAFNDAVLDVLEMLPRRYGPGVQPSISTVAPNGRNRFFERLVDIKNRRFGNGWFQMQFSLHTTCDTARRRLIPIKTWPLEKIAAFAADYIQPGDKKIALNFAPAAGFPLDPAVLSQYFSKENVIIKLTPINPTERAIASGLVGIVDPARPDTARAVANQFEREGFETIVSIGDLEENVIGSNCGMYVSRFNQTNTPCAPPERSRPRPAQRHEFQ